MQYKRSMWQATCGFPEREPLKGIHKVDVAVIGAGMAGILTAYQLKQRGVRVVVLDRKRLGEGVTGGTTAKITSQHRLIYDQLIGQYGMDMAKQYALANCHAIRQYEELIEKMEIDCDFQKKDAYVYTRGNIEKLEREAKAADRLGIPGKLTKCTELPFSAKGALCFPNQAQFHPLKFLRAVAETLPVYEMTQVRGVEEGTVFFNGGQLHAKFVVMATHYPIINVPGFYFIRMHQSRSYVLALEDIPELSGMYIDEQESGLSFRSVGNTLLLGGGGHRTGKNPSKSGKVGSYERLRHAAKMLYPTAQEHFSWSAQDCITPDGIPYIGQYAPSTPRFMVATGFNKWGMTGSMVAATLLADRITGIRNACAPVFSPRRFSMRAAAKNVAIDGVQSTIGLVSEAFHIPSKDLAELKNGTGGIVEYNGVKVGAYKAENGEVFLVSTRCTHLGCELKWNPDEKTWDCPCHGSRFDIYGRWVESPAVKHLRKK